jgi:hypothetical protein
MNVELPKCVIAYEEESYISIIRAALSYPRSTFGESEIFKKMVELSDSKEVQDLLNENLLEFKSETRAYRKERNFDCLFQLL